MQMTSGLGNGFQEHARFAVHHGSYLDVQHLGPPGCPRSSRVYPAPVASPYSSPPGDDLIRRLRQVVQDRLVPSVRWADIPQLSTQDRRCPAACIGNSRG